MSTTQDRALDASLSGLLATLVDFEQMPGRYPLALREPRLLFDQTHTVLLLAAGRTVEGLALNGDEQETTARRAARFFVRTALLRPGVDHYALLGLTPGCDAAEIREHYRLMIRLTHPDFVASGEAWPADAATRINIANDVLSSAVQRSLYNATLAASGTPAAAASGGAAAVAPRAVRPRPGVIPRRARLGNEQTGWSRRSKVALASTGAVLSAGLLLFIGEDGQDSSLAVKPQTATVLPAMAKQAPAEPAPQVEAATLVAVATPSAPPTPSPSTAVARIPTAVTEQAPTPARTKPTRVLKRVTPVEPEPVQVAAPEPRVVRALAGESGLSLAMDTRLSAPGLVAAPPAALEPTATAKTTGPARIGIAEVQPTLALLVDAVQTGRGENLVQWVDRAWYPHPATASFVHQFNQLLAGQHVTQLGKVAFRSRMAAEQLVVDGVIELHLQDGSRPEQVRELQLRAHFMPQDSGKPVLTRLVAGTLQ